MKEKKVSLHPTKWQHMCETSGMIRHGVSLGTEQDRASTASCWIHLCCQRSFLFILIPLSLIAENLLNPPCGRFQRDKEVILHRFVKLLRAFNCTWFWMSYDFFICFRNFQKLLQNHWIWQILGLSKSITHQKTHFQSAIKTLRYALIYYEMPVK